MDEAHKMSAYADDKKTLAYRLGESLSDMTENLLVSVEDLLVSVLFSSKKYQTQLSPRALV